MAQHAPLVLVDPRYCLPQEVTLVMQEKMGFKDDHFTIADPNGTPYFSIDAKLLSMSNKRTLYDAYRQPAVVIQAKQLSLHGIWFLSNPTTGQKIAEVKPSMFSLKPSINVYLNDGDKEADFTIKGNFRAKKFEICHRTPAGDRVIASVKKESKFASTTAFLMNTLTNADKYFVTIQPGVDAAFVVALASLVDETCHDTPPASQQGGYTG